MKQLLLSERGAIGVVPILLIVALVAVAALGIYNYHRADQLAHSQDLPLAVAPAAATPTIHPGDQLSIPEPNNFQVALTSDIGDLTYSAQTDSAGHPKAVFSSKRLAAADAHCSATAGTGVTPLGALVMIAQADDTIGLPVSKGRSTNYFYFVTPQSACGDTAATNQLETQQLKAVKQALGISTN